MEGANDPTDLWKFFLLGQVGLLTYLFAVPTTYPTTYNDVGHWQSEIS